MGQSALPCQHGVRVLILEWSAQGAKYILKMLTDESGQRPVDLVQLCELCAAGRERDPEWEGF